MALEADTIAGLILGVLGLIGLPMMYKFGKRIWKSLVGEGHFSARLADCPRCHRKSSKIWPRKNAGVLPTTSTDLQVRTGTAVRTMFG